MKIREMYETKKTVISFEVFPPKAHLPIEGVYETIEALQEENPDFISVTYGAGGSSKGRTVEIATRLKQHYGIEALAHLTCISSTKQEVAQVMEQLKANGIENILAMRGDIPQDPDFTFPSPLQYEYAKDLIGQIKAEGGFSIGAACYPEGHPECPSRARDILNLKMKVEAGADFLITQLFFDNEVFYDFMEKLEIAGIDLPVSAGIMPCLNASQILRMKNLCGCEIPPKFMRIIRKYEHNPEALKEAGEAYAIGQIVDLMAWGVRGIHLYTMNRPDTTKRIMRSIGSIRELSR